MKCKQITCTFYVQIIKEKLIRFFSLDVEKNAFWFFFFWFLRFFRFKQKNSNHFICHFVQFFEQLHLFNFPSLSNEKNIFDSCEVERFIFLSWSNINCLISQATMCFCWHHQNDFVFMILNECWYLFHKQNRYLMYFC